MGLVCNGIMVSGTHILLKAAQLFGYHRIHGSILSKGYVPKYFYRDKIPGDKILSNKDVLPHSWIEEELGDRVIHSHCPGLLTNHKHIVILRDPRNVLAARTKKIYDQLDSIKGQPWKPKLRKRMTGDKQQDALIVLKNMDVVKETKDMLATSAFYVHFEQIFNQDTVDEMADYVEKPSLAVNRLYGGTPTFTGTQTNWEEYWSSPLDNLFQKLGGYEVLKRYEDSLHRKSH